MERKLLFLMPNPSTKRYVSRSICIVLFLSDLRGNIIYFDVEFQIRGSDTSTAESGSEADDVTSPKALRSYISHPKLTPVREEVSS
jgi:hypothetical protein